VPSTLTDGVVAETESLSDLVDLAVDAGEAVLREPGGDYLVQYGDVVYRYQPPDPEAVHERGGFDLREGLPSVELNNRLADSGQPSTDGGVTDRHGTESSEAVTVRQNTMEPNAVEPNTMKQNTVEPNDETLLDREESDPSDAEQE